MRNPIRSETDAFYVACGGAVLIGVSVALGALLDPLVGAALFAGAVVGALVWLETGIVERLRDELEIPVTHLTVDLDPAGRVAVR